MNTLQRLRQGSLWLALAGSTLLAACGGSDTPATPTLSGTAAVGLPIVGGSVSVKCAGGSALSSTTTTSGGWSTTLSGRTLPCAVEVSGGTVGGAASTATYHSIALTAGTVNITPLTNLVVASVLGASPATWFASPVFTAFNATNVSTALNTLKTQLGLATALGSADPLTTAFTANGSDSLDKLLDALSDALTGAGLDYATLLAAAQSNSFSSVSGFSAAFGSAWTALGGSSGGGSTSCGAGETATTYSGAAGTYTNGQSVCFAASPTQLAFLGQSLGSPVQNTTVSAPFSAYAFSDSATGERYEVVFNAGALYEINLLSSSAQFLGQFTPASSGGSGGTGNLTVEVLINGVGASSVTISGVPTPGSQTDFCNDVQSDSTLTGLATGGGTLTINSCSFSNGVGTINATVTVTTPVPLSLPYTVRYTYS